MLAGIGEEVSVRRSAAEMAVAVPGENGHPVADPCADEHALLLGRAAEHPEEHLGRGGREVDPAGDLGEPQLDAEVLEEG